MTDRIAVEYHPEASERMPWTITINGTPTVRVAEAWHATDALTAAPGFIDDGWTASEAVYRALQDTAALTLDQWDSAN